MNTIQDYIAKDAKTIEFLDLPKYQIIVTFYAGAFVVSYMHKQLGDEPRHHVFSSVKSALHEANRIFNLLSIGL